MINALLIVWRESLEAVLVIGILYAGLTRLSPDRRALRYLWAGTFAGIVASALLGYFSLEIRTHLEGEALAFFEIAVLFLAAALITQMVLWMHHHGRHMRRQIETQLHEKMSASSVWGPAALALFAVAREGTETVVFLYGMGLERGAQGLGELATGAVLGFLLALFTAWAVARGIRGLSYRVFFRVTGVALLFLGAGLLVSATNRLIDMGVLPPLVDGIWDSSWLLPEGTLLGGIVSAFTGYRAHPSLMLVLVYAAYWLFAIGWMRRGTGAAPAHA